jgi:hypothetical protein
MASRSIPARRRLALLAGSLVLAAAMAPSASAAATRGSVTFTKTCGEICTVQDSDLGLIPPGSTLTYSGPRFDPHLSSGFVLDTPDGSAPGHCNLSWATGLGNCVIDPGSGTLAGFHAYLAESVDFVDPNDFGSWIFTLSGRYEVDAAHA